LKQNGVFESVGAALQMLACTTGQKRSRLLDNGRITPGFLTEAHQCRFVAQEKLEHTGQKARFSRSLTNG
jgi:hypothetical protein